MLNPRKSKRGYGIVSKVKNRFYQKGRARPFEPFKIPLYYFRSYNGAYICIVNSYKKKDQNNEYR